MIDPAIHYKLHSGPPAGSDKNAKSDPILILVADRDTAVILEPVTDDESDPLGSGSSTEPQVRFPRLAELSAVGAATPAAKPDAAGTRAATPAIAEGAAADIIARCQQWHQIAVWRRRPVYALSVTDEDLDLLAQSASLGRENYRNLYLRISEIELGLFARAIQIVEWYATTGFCSACGKPTTVSEAESVARCTECGHDQYPQLAPAMIVAVQREGEILLARSPRFRGAFHSVLAGFVEPGESVEECVHREIYEETKVRVRNVRYFGSQSWPFPHSLMLGFTADWASGEIEIDGVELEHADWYGPDDMPPVPSELSISGRLIKNFRESCG